MDGTGGVIRSLLALFRAFACSRLRVLSCLRQIDTFVIRSNPLPFFLLLALFHLGVGGVSVALGARWVRWLRKPMPGFLWGVRLLADATIFGFASVAFAAGLALFYHSPAFTALRLVCQALFAEALLLSAWIAVAH